MVDIDQIAQCQWYDGPRTITAGGRFMNWRIISISLLSAALVWVAPVKAQEDEGSVDDGTRICISTRRIRHTRIIDDRNVLFYLSSTNILHNVLRQTCPGLKYNGQFSYTTTTGRICEGDGIAPMRGSWGTVRPVPVCWLGIHREISREQADMLREAAKLMPAFEPSPLPIPEPSEIGNENKDPE